MKSLGIWVQFLGRWESFMEAKGMGSFDMRYLYFDYDSFHDHQVYFKTKRKPTRQMNA